MKKFLNILVSLAAIASLTACEDAVFDDQGDCSTTYKLHLAYTHNLKWADAFPTEVTNVGIYAFDTSGALVWKGNETAEHLRDGNYCVNLPLDPGAYDIVVWGGGKSREPQALGWALADGDNIASKSGISCRLNTTADENGAAVAASDIHRLYHGTLSQAVMPDEPGVFDYEIDLTKDTNFIRVILQHADGEPVNPAWFSFKITDTNSELDHTNAASGAVTYSPWDITVAETEMPDPDKVAPGTAGKSAAGSRAVSRISSVIADFTTSRLVKGNRPTIDIRCIEPGNEHLVARLDLISYFLMIKGTANRHIEDQDFLDRQDDYTMMLILDDNNRWNMKLGLYINSWRIVKQNETIE